MKRLLRHPRVRKHAKQGLKFCICGLLGATLEFSIIGILVDYFLIDVHIAYIPSGLVSLVFVFFFNKYITFGNRDKKAAEQTVRFLIVYGMAFIINYTLASAFYVLGSHYLSLEDVTVALLAKALAIGITAFWNYFFSSGFVFRRSPPPVEFSISASV